MPGLRDHVPGHWQTLLASRLPGVRTVAAMCRQRLDCKARVDAIEREAARIDGPIVLVAHSGGVIATIHWARQTQRAVRGALLATPADFERPLPGSYPSMEALGDAGWLPVPRDALPFRSIVAASRNDPLASYARLCTCEGVAKQARRPGRGWPSQPPSGLGDWPQADGPIRDLDAAGRRPGQSTPSVLALHSIDLHEETSWTCLW